MRTLDLEVLLPERVLLEHRVTKVVAEAEDGSFGILPRHIDFVAPLAPGILSFVDAESGEEQFLAVGQGLLIKRGREVLVSVQGAVRGENLGDLERSLRQDLVARDERERRARRAAHRLEADMVRRLVELREEWP